jgi:predicted dehydrogenase
MIWLFGEVDQLSGFRKNMAHQASIEFEDTGVVSLQMKNGMIGGLNWSINTFSRNMEVSLSLIAENGNIRIGGEYMNKVEFQLTESASLHVSETGQANDYGTYQGSMSNHDKIYKNLVMALSDQQHPFASAAEGLKTVETIERIYKFVSLQ